MKAFWYKVFNDIISVQDATKVILSRDQILLTLALL